jgi:hypothetical protein
MQALLPLRARYRLLANAPVNYGSEYPEPDRNPPHQIVVAAEIVQPAGAPATQEAAELMAEKDDAP